MCAGPRSPTGLHRWRSKFCPSARNTWRFQGGTYLAHHLHSFKDKAGTRREAWNESDPCFWSSLTVRILSHEAASSSAVFINPVFFPKSQLNFVFVQHWTNSTRGPYSPSGANKMQPCRSCLPINSLDLSGAVGINIYNIISSETIGAALSLYGRLLVYTPKRSILLAIYSGHIFMGNHYIIFTFCLSARPLVLALKNSPRIVLVTFFAVSM